MKNIKCFAFVIFAFIALPNAFGQSTTQSPGPWVKIVNGQLMVDLQENGVYTPYFIKAVGYSPMPITRTPSDWGWPSGDPRDSNMYDDPAILNRDFALLQQMHANTIRVWKGNDTTEYGGRFPNKITTNTLTLAQQYNIKVIAGFWVDPLVFDTNNNIVGTTNDLNNTVAIQDLISRFVAYVNAFKNNPAILMWAIGNENNYQTVNGQNMTPQQLTSWYALANQLAVLAHQIEGVNAHPVAIVNGEINEIGNSADGAADSQLPAVDVWGANIYRGQSFGTLFSDYQKKSQKPLWVSEFGVDAWHGTDLNNFDTGYEDQPTQSTWVTGLWSEIFNNFPVTIGGSIMEYSDEWWKPYEYLCTDTGIYAGLTPTICNDEQNHFGSLFPAFFDGEINQEWFGIMKISLNVNPTGPDVMTPRSVYAALQTQWLLNPQTSNLAITQFNPLFYTVKSSYTIKEGRQIAFAALIKNQGSSTSTAGSASFYVDAQLLSQANIPALKPGKISLALSSYWTAAVGTHQIQVTVANNTSTFTVVVKPDTTPPVVIYGSPMGTLPYGTKQTDLIVATTEPANCKYATSAGVAYAAMPNTFQFTGARISLQSITGLTNGVSEQYYVKCEDFAATPNITPSDYVIKFSVSNTPPPKRR